MQDSGERPPIATQPISLILTSPKDNTELEAALRDWVTYLNGLDQVYEVLLIDEAEASSSPIVEGIYAHVRLLPPDPPGGFGAALRRGFATAIHPLVFYARCDLRFKPMDLKQLLQWIDKVDLVAGQRVWPKVCRRKRLRQWLFRLVLRVIAAVRLKDVECLFVLARRSVFARIPIQSHGLFAHAEILAKANFLGCLMTEVPVAFRPLPGVDSSSLSANLRVLRDDARRVRRYPDFGPPPAIASAAPELPMPIPTVRPEAGDAASKAL